MHVVTMGNYHHKDSTHFVKTRDVVNVRVSSEREGRSEVKEKGQWHPRRLSIPQRDQRGGTPKSLDARIPPISIRYLKV